MLRRASFSEAADNVWNPRVVDGRTAILQATAESQRHISPALSGCRPSASRGSDRDIHARPGSRMLGLQDYTENADASPDVMAAVRSTRVEPVLPQRSSPHFVWAGARYK